MSFYVKRERFVQQRNNVGWTGPIRSERQAKKEQQAWENAGWTATVVPSTPQVRKQIRAWEREQKTSRALAFGYHNIT